MSPELEAIVEEMRAAEIADREANILWKRAIEAKTLAVSREVEACNETNHTKQRAVDAYMKLKMTFLKTARTL